jgi:hypothetical protein
MVPSRHPNLHLKRRTNQNSSTSNSCTKFRTYGYGQTKIIFTKTFETATVACKKKTGTVRMKLTHFYNLFIFLVCSGKPSYENYGQNSVTRHLKKLFDRYCQVYNN